MRVKFKKKILFNFHYGKIDLGIINIKKQCKHLKYTTLLIFEIINKINKLLINYLYER